MLSFQLSVPTLMLCPPCHFEIDCADEILAMIEIHLDFFLPVRFCQKLFWVVYELLISAWRIFTEIVKHHDHPGFDFLQHLDGAMRVHLPKLGFDHLLRGFRTVFTLLHWLGKLRQPADIGVLMAGEQFIQPWRHCRPCRLMIHAPDMRAFRIQHWPHNSSGAMSPIVDRSTGVSPGATRSDQ